MAHVQRLSIQGVRSFDPENSEEIIFFPLTIILGPNGAGKTSIIESLKYATTGIMPPSSNNGKTFIHDIQYADKPIIRGQIRLKFIDVENKSTVITRSIQASQKYQKNKKCQVTFKQLNSVIKRDGNSIDQKCADINSELLELIGVSKAVLTNVIFCHQEETNWPLYDGKVLKEKFDDIFGSIAYVKTLEKIKKSREEEVKKLHLLEKDVTYAQHLKKEVDKKKRNLSEEVAKLNSEKDKVNNLEDKIKEVNKNLNQLVEKESSIQELMGEISQYEAMISAKQDSIDGIEKQCKEATLKLKSDMVGAKLDSFDDNLVTSKYRKEELESKLEELDSEYFSLIKQKQAISTDIVKIDEFEKQLNKYKNKRDDIIKKIKLENVKPILEKLKCGSELLPEDYENVEVFLNSSIKTVESELDCKKQSFTKEEKELKQKLDSLKSNRSNINHEKQIWLQQCEKTQKEIDDLAASLEEKGYSETYLSTVDEKILFYKTQMAKLNNFDEAKFKLEMESLENEKKVFKDDIEKLDQQISLVNEYNEEKIKYNYLNSQKEEKNSLLEEIKMNNLEMFMRVDAMEGTFHPKLNSEIFKVSSEIDNLNVDVSKLEKEFYTKKTKLESKQDSVKNKEKTLNSLKNKFENVCSIDEFENFMAATKKFLDNLRLEKSSLENIAPVINKQIEMIELKQICPVCENDLSNGWTSKATNDSYDCSLLVSKLKQSLVTNPVDLNKVNKNIIEKENLLNKLIQLEGDLEIINQINSELPLIKMDVSSLTQEIDNVQKCLEKQKTKLKTLKDDLVLLRKCVQDANDYDKSFKELNDICRKLENFNCDKWRSDVDIEMLKIDLNQKRISLKTCDKKLSDMQKEFIKISDDKVKTQNMLQAAERNKSSYEKQQQDKLANANNKEKLILQLEELQAKVYDLTSRSTDFDPDIEFVEKRLQLLKEDFNKFSENCQQTIYSYQDSLKSFSSIVSEISKYSQELESIKRRTSTDFISELDFKLSDFENKKRGFTKQIDQIKEEMANSELERRELLNYQKLLNLKEQIFEHQKKLQDARNRMGNVDYSTLKRTLIQTEREAQKLDTQKQNGLARIQEITERVNSINDELEQEEYSNAEKLYEKSFIEKTLSELLCDDLNMYYKALDNAITSFHKSKMEEINKLIKNFWTLAYQGNDIDYIQIVSEEEERSASDRRRSYNYRVVMYRRNKEMDMKGRCSAGQKVLGSLIIRLALAVIFCRKFPVLALDEPTTNLDKENIHSFAKAVINLIKSNQSTLNFQIIIITHDEEFLQCLDADTGEFYYRVSKNKYGYSSIEKRSILENTDIFDKQDINDSDEKDSDDDDDVPLQIAAKKSRID